MRRKEKFTIDSTENTENTDAISVNSVPSVVNTNDIPTDFQMTELGPLPKEWRVVKLGEVANLKQGRTPKRNLYDDKRGRRIIKVKDFQDGEKVTVTPSGDRSYVSIDIGVSFQVQAEDVLILNSGHSAEVVGQKIGIVPPELEGAFYVAELTAIRALSDTSNSYYLFSCLMHPQQREKIRALVKGGHLYTAQLKSLPIPLPPLPEQRAIAHVLRTVQRAKEATEGVIAALKELKKSLMQHLFTYGPVPVTERERVALQETEIGPLPAHWRVVRLGEVFDIMQGKSLSAKQNKGVRPRPFLRTSNVYWGYLDLSKLDVMDFTEEEEQKFALQRGDLLVCEGGDVGRTAMWEDQLQGVYYQNHLHRLRAKHDSVNPAFVMYWLQAAFNLLNLYTGSSNKTTIPNLSRGRLSVFPIPLPPLSEQREIARTLQAVDAKIAAEQARRAALEDLFKTLLHQLMTGQIRVRGVIPTSIDSAESAAMED